MPPNRTASNGRKPSVDTDDESQATRPIAKKAKVSSSMAKQTENSLTLAPNGQPTNKVLPVKISFPQKREGALRIATWNICGLNTSMKKGFRHYIEAEDPDILVLTETKVNDAPIDPLLTSRFPHRAWSIAEKKSYSGTAILSKHKPLSVTTVLPNHPDPSSVKGRLVALEFAGCFVVGTYVVNAGQGLKTLDAKNTWNTHFTKYIRELDGRKPVIWVGDLNVAPTDIDLAKPKPNWNKTPGYTKDETDAFKEILNTEGKSAKFVDVWRRLHPKDRHYTYFSYRFNCREKGLGWRLDMFVLSERLEPHVKMCEIRSEIYGASDHVPVVLEIDEVVVLGSS
ncbi:hypothetical protein CONPUDRAFT_79799 [Coniophora puteana RWD-64-598 SS2]|uniref:Endonuclease/exonuclease/phosphatase domain-containing protein n=1 Tax=Coniophora puteana (strain RWD-64-598) TaxID=741705 RepID=A0A5M3N1G3_CONPW|nr:uncharacterized protein CONPUDRAFT_79799 [Coniophora puteana RWD-64-598 SS2]EIW85107.1 hypothetical protein CONPUDRAFT_79799 [Coniophora puteana RWD-64-598 SS2]